MHVTPAHGSGAHCDPEQPNWQVSLLSVYLHTPDVQAPFESYHVRIPLLHDPAGGVVHVTPVHEPVVQLLPEQPYMQVSLLRRYLHAPEEHVPGEV